MKEQVSEKQLETEFYLTSSTQMIKSCPCSVKTSMEYNSYLNSDNSDSNNFNYNDSTFLETNLNGGIHSISCTHCDDEISYNHTDNIVDEWNKSCEVKIKSFSDEFQRDLNQKCKVTKIQ